MYEWRRMTKEEREAVMRARVRRGGAWRRPPLTESGHGRYMITAACFEHAPIIGCSVGRIAEFEDILLNCIAGLVKEIHAHVVLPNHYHLIVETPAIAPLRAGLGKLHGATSYKWNGEDGCRGRKVFHGCPETFIKSERHFWACMNYVHHNPVKHGYVARWQDWPFTSARDFLESVGLDQARIIWKSHPIDRFGANWDF